MDVWEKDVWDFQAKSGSSGTCRFFLHFLGKIAVQKWSGKAPGSPRHPSFRRLFVTCDIFARYFLWLFRGFFPQKNRRFSVFFVFFSWLFRGPRFGKFYAYSTWKNLLILPDICGLLTEDS